MTTPTPGRPPSPLSLDLAALLDRCAAGDQEAFAALYDATASRVFGLAMRLIRNRAQAEEVAQEVYLQLWRNCGTFDASRGGAISWVLMHTHSVAVARVRAESSRTHREACSERQDRPLRRPGADPTHETADLTLEAVRARGAMARISPKQREALEMAYFDGHTYSEVATELGIPLGTAKSRIRDGLLRLRDLLEETRPGSVGPGGNSAGSLAAAPWAGGARSDLRGCLPPPAGGLETGGLPEPWKGTSG